MITLYPVLSYNSLLCSTFPVHLPVCVCLCQQIIFSGLFFTSVLQISGACNLQVAGSSPFGAPLCGGLGQAAYTCVPLSPSSTIWYWPRGGGDFLGWESNCGPGRK